MTQNKKEKKKSFIKNNQIHIKTKNETSKVFH